MVLHVCDIIIRTFLLHSFKWGSKFLYEKQKIIGSNTDSTVFHKKGFDGVATTERYSTVPFPKEAASLFIKDKDKVLF